MIEMQIALSLSSLYQQNLTEWHLF